MKLKRCMKRISAVLLAATMIVVSLPNLPGKTVVEAAEEKDFPEEIMFPISVLDFPADNLFFEYPMSWDGGFDSGLDTLGVSDMKGLVNQELENDPASLYYRLPVYTEDSVAFIARAVYNILNTDNMNRTNVDYPYINHVLNPLSIRNYIRKQDWKVLNAEDGELSNGAEIRSSDKCLKTKFVGNLGGTEKGSVTFKYNASFAGVHKVRFFPICVGSRDLYISVNGNAPQKVSCSSTGTTWDTPSDTPEEALIDKFVVGNNTIVISGNPNGTEWAPDLDRIEIQNLTGNEPEPVDPNEYFKVEAEIDGSTVYPGGGNDMEIVKNASATLGYSNNGYARIGNWWWDNNYVDGVNKVSYKSGKFSLPAGYDAGKYDIKVYGTRNATNYAGFVVSGNDEKGKDGLGKSTSLKKPFFVISNVDLKKNDNTIIFRGNDTNIDKFVICKAGTASTNVASADDYPIGSYEESKAKYNTDEDGDKVSDYGWYDIETCYDYAYFITATLFKYHPSLNTLYNNYNNLIFHRVKQNDNIYYEFMGDLIHYEKISRSDYNTRVNKVYDNLVSKINSNTTLSAAKKAEKIRLTNAERNLELSDARYNSITSGAGKLVYNPEERTIRNACNENGKYVGPEAGEYETRSGSMFICDGDDYYTKPRNATNTAAKDIKKYPAYDNNYNDNFGETHNFHYTIRTHSRFVYKPGTDQQFFFSGDDDVYVFVNGHLLVDLGGSHEQMDDSFNLDELATDPKYGLEPEKTVDFDFFYVERHRSESNFWGKMSFELKNDEVELQWPTEPNDIAHMPNKQIPYGWVVDLDYKFSSMRELTTNKDLIFSDDLEDEIGYTGFKLADIVKLKDNTLKVVFNKIQTDGTYVTTIDDFYFADPHHPTEEEVNRVKTYFAKLELNEGDTLELKNLLYDTAKKQFMDFGETGDPRVRETKFKTRVDYKSYMTMDGVNSIEQSGFTKMHADQEVTVGVVIGALVVDTKVDYDDENYQTKKTLAAFGEFTLIREETEDDLSTPDVNESIIYKNKYLIDDGRKAIIFDNVEHDGYPASKTIYREPIPKGTYTLKLDIEMLTGYTIGAEVRIGDEVYKFDSLDEEKLINGVDCSIRNGLVIKIDPKLNSETQQWEYPTVEYIIKAYREVNPFKDLT